MNLGAPLVVLALAVSLDLTIEEWPERIHPVSWFGQLVAVFDRSWQHPRAFGVALAAFLPAVVAVLSGAIIVIAFDVHQLLGILAAGGILFTTVSLRMLLSVAQDVIQLIEDDLTDARKEIRALVGRYPTDLSPFELRSAVIESLAENLSDGFMAPLLGFVIGAQGSIAIGVAAAVWVKAVNTMDSILGDESKPIGWASARLDDVVMWIPARATALVLAVGAGDLRSPMRARVWAQAPKSPNSGWPMATLAVILSVELSKPGEYELNPTSHPPTKQDALRGVRITGVSGLLTTVFAGIVLWL